MPTTGSLIAFFRLMRPLNLAIIVLTMVAMREGIIGGYLDLHTRLLQSAAVEVDGSVFAAVPGNVFEHAFPALQFWLLVLSTVLIAAGGNIINDYFDTRIDRINRPGGVIVGRTVKRRVAMAGHLVISTIGVLLGLWVAWRSGNWRWGLIPIFAVTTLWFYSTTLKRAFLIGNGVVAVLSALVPLTVGLYEIPALAQAYPAGMTATTTDGRVMVADFDWNTPWFAILIFAFFAFLTTLIRELQKDMADITGDKADGRRTIPIVLGQRWAKRITLLYIGITLPCLLAVRMTYLHDRFSYWYVGIGVLGPLLLSAGFTYNAFTRRDHTMADHLTKATMAMAIGYAFLMGHTVWQLQ